MKKMDKWDAALFAGFAVVSHIAVNLYAPLAFIILGAAFMLLAPFVIVERYGIPLLRERPRLAVLAALACITIGGLSWLAAVKMG